MKWEDVLKRTDIVGGELETQEDGYVYRGPIATVELQNGLIFFTSPWVARKDEDGVWKKWHITSSHIDAEMCPPTDVGNGRVLFNIPLVGIGVIFPKGGSQLRVTQVEGL